jgi:beta-1,2-mannosidase
MVTLKSCIAGFVLALAALLPQPSSQWAIGPFSRPSGEPVIVPDPKAIFDDPISRKPVRWEALHTFNPAAIVRDGKVCLLYRAEDDTGEMRIGGHTSRLGLAFSSDGIHFSRLPDPVFFPSMDAQTGREWPGGVEDPRIVESEDGTYVLTYTQYNRRTYDVGVATSSDLVHWQKFGPAFQDASGGKYRNLEYKSAGIVTTLKDGKLVATKINGKYWMYWGEKTVRVATSADLVHWSPVEDSDGKPVVVLGERPGHFDSGFPEVGPPPVLTKHGIVVIYNGKNAVAGGDPQLEPGTYAVGQALFAADNPLKLLDRLDQPFLAPATPFERTGQYKEGTTFAEGLVYFKKKWFLYYGAADSFVGVAIASENMRGAIIAVTAQALGSARNTK